MDEESTQDSAPKILSIADILAADDLEEKTLDLPAWGGSIRIRALARGDIKKAYRLGTDKKSGDIDVDAVERFLVCWASVEPKISPADFDKLAAKNAGPVARIIDAVLGLSGVDKAALERARESFRD
jgi:hypothetical protein